MSPLESITFAANSQLATIGSMTFVSSKLTSIIIPASVTSIGSSSFQNVDTLTSVTFENTSGWKTGSYSIDVTDPATNATNIKGSRANYTWTRS